MCWKLLKVGIAAGIVGIVVSLVIQMLTAETTSAIFQATASMWKPMSAPEWSLMYLVPLWVGVFMAVVYRYIDKKQAVFRKGWIFGFVVWLLAGFPGMLMTYSSFALPNELVGLWMCSGLLQYMAMGWVIAKMKP
jgi:hypothetical protein